jgi:hypothetical protein
VDYNCLCIGFIGRLENSEEEMIGRVVISILQPIVKA